MPCLEPRRAAAVRAGQILSTPYQSWPGRRSVGPGSATPGVTVGQVGSVCGGVAVTVAVSPRMDFPSPTCVELADAHDRAAGAGAGRVLGRPRRPPLRL